MQTVIALLAAFLSAAAQELQRAPAANEAESTWMLFGLECDPVGSGRDNNCRP